MRTRYNSSTLLVACALLVPVFKNDALISRSMPHLWSLGFGTINSEALVSMKDSLDLSGPAGVIHRRPTWMPR